MTAFYIPKSGTVTVNRIPYRLVRGIYDISDALADSHEANAFGIKPVNEMTDDEWRLSGHVKAEWLADQEAREKPVKAGSKPPASK